jgi:hypothetical protein
VTAFPEVVIPPARYVQGVDEVVDYSIDYSAFLGNDTIVASSWTCDVSSSSGLELSKSSYSTTSTTIWVAAGLAGYAYRLLNHVTTAGGRQFDRKMWVKIRGLCD